MEGSYCETVILDYTIILPVMTNPHVSFNSIFNHNLDTSIFYNTFHTLHNVDRLFAGVLDNNNN